MATEDCPFCEKISLGEFDFTRDGCVVFEPLNPVTPGHLLIVPIEHAPDASQDPNVGRAVQLAGRIAAHRKLQANIITSIGPLASQSVFHTHIHLVPRRENDGLTLPWTGQKR